MRVRFARWAREPESALVGSSWGFAYVALKQLPLSIASPIRATSPLWTVIIATTFLGERPDILQWIGVIVILAALYLFSLVGRREGIHFHRDKWVICMFVATILSSFCALYDKDFQSILAKKDVIVGIVKPRSTVFFEFQIDTIV